MGVFRQLGDPVYPPCLCQHHEANYGEYEPPTPHTPLTPNMVSATLSMVIASSTITTTERCCIVVNAATLTDVGTIFTNFEIERPLGMMRTMQQARAATGALSILHHAAWEVLDPGTYTYYLVHTNLTPHNVYGAWLTPIASDCEG